MLTALLLVCGPWPSASTAALPGQARVPDAVMARAAQQGQARVIVRLAAPTPPRGSSSPEARIQRIAIGWQLDGLVDRIGLGPAQRVRRIDASAMVAFDATPAMLRRLADDPVVGEVAIDAVRRPSLIESTAVAGADLTAAAGLDGAGAAVAILDSGIEAGHPFFGNRIVAEACFTASGDCPGGTMTASGPGSAAPCSLVSECFHGTHVAGIAAGQDSQRQGVAPAADIVAVQVFSLLSGATDCPPPGPDPCLGAFDSDLVMALNWVGNLTSVDVGAVNMSLGGGDYANQAQCNADNGFTKTAIDAIVAQGINVVAAAGNDGSTSTIDGPACVASAIAVAGISDWITVYNSSNSNALIDVFAPAINVKSSSTYAFNSTGYTTATGTSMATPHVAGALAVLRSLAPGASAATLRSLLLDEAPLFTDPRNGVTRPRVRVDASAVALAPGECFDGLDNDGDGDVDFADDPGCVSGFAIEGRACDDGIDNDGDGRTDWDGGGVGPADPQCNSATDSNENSNRSCGLGPEPGLLLPLLAALRRRARSLQA